MKIKSYTIADEFPSNCWFADYQPQNATMKKQGFVGEVILRLRDDNATVSLISIPVGKAVDINEDKAEEIANLLLNKLNS